MDKNTFLSRIKGKIDCDAIRKTGDYGPWWIDIFDDCKIIVYSQNTDFNAGYAIAILRLDETNPPEDITRIRFYCKGEETESVSDSFANDALAALPYKGEEEKELCKWINNNGGKGAIRVSGISELILAYLGAKDIGFRPTVSEIAGVIMYYLGNTRSGDDLTGC